MRAVLFCFVLVAVSACSPEAPSAPPEQNRSAGSAAPDAAKLPSPEAASAERNEAKPAAPKRIAATGRRCGWLHNPTPANWWLVDGDGQWVLGSQGSEPVAGMEEMPDMSTGEWVETNGHYGYGCACMDMVVDPAGGGVLRISNAAPKPLAQCRRDRYLPNPDEG